MDFRDKIYGKYSRVLKSCLGPKASILELEGVLVSPEEFTHPSERLKGCYSVYISTDVSGQIKEVKKAKGIECAILDSRKLPFKDKSFDLVHVTFPARVLEFQFKDKTVCPTFSEKSLPGSGAEIRRVLKKDGAFVFFPFFKYSDEQDIAWQEGIVKEFEKKGFMRKEEELYADHAVVVFKRVTRRRAFPEACPSGR